jgi:translation elongation factor EF-1beta
MAHHDEPQHENDDAVYCTARSSSTDTDDDITSQLQRLGDPSGRQDATYWDEWFQIVCCRRDNNHKPFEWYCDCQQVARVLSFHLLGGQGGGQGDAAGNNKDNNNNKMQGRNKKKMIHPGSGTSLLALALQADFPDYEHVVVDISEIAIQEMKEFHSKQAAAAADANVEYRTANLLLDDNLDFETDSFQCWIDKGFIDAVFSKKTNSDDHKIDQQQASRLFQQACRILNDDANVGDDGSVAGFALIVSLAEDHSFRLILDNWFENIQKKSISNTPDESSESSSSSVVNNNKYSCYFWAPCLDIWELVPVSGNMRPFGFVLTKGKPIKDDEENVTIAVRWHGLDDIVQEIYSTPLKLNNDDDKNKHDEIRTMIHARLSQSRQALMEESACDKNKNESVKDERLVMATLEVKPLDADVDLVALAKRIQASRFEVETTSSSSHRYIQPQWRPVLHQESSSSLSSNNDLLLYEIVPIGFGLSKLVLACVLPSDDVDELVTLIEEMYGNDRVQSVDVDWSRTIPVMSNVLSKLQIPSMS